MKIYEHRLLQPHPQKKHITKWKKLPAKKVRKINMTVKDKRPLLLFIEQVFDSWVISFIFHFYFPWLIIDHKLQCIQAKTFETQVSWSLDSCTHKWDHSSPRFSYTDEEKVKKNIMWYIPNINRKSFLINQHYNTMSSPDNSKIFLLYLHVKYDTRWNVALAGL